MDYTGMTSPELIELLIRDFQTGDAGGEELYRAALELARREEPAVSAGRAWAVFREKYLPFAGGGVPLWEDTGAPSAPAAAVQPLYPALSPADDSARSGEVPGAPVEI